MKNYIMSWKSIIVLSVIVGVAGFLETAMMFSAAPKNVVFEGACSVEPTDKLLNATCGDFKREIKDASVIAPYMLALNTGKNEGVYCKATHRTFDDETEWACSYGKPVEEKK